MAFVDWTPGLSVKVDEMDNQHKVLIGLINQLHDAMKTGKGKEIIGKSLEATIKYAQTHFKQEEVYMEKLHYPELGMQKRAHEAYIRKALDFQKRYQAGEERLLNEVLNFLWNWLNEHIKKEDAKYGAYAAQKQGVAVR